MKSKIPLFRSTVFVAGFAALIVVAIVAIRLAGKAPATVLFKPSATVAISKPALPVSPVPAVIDKIISRPLPVSLREGTHEWTEGDATSPEIIEKIAHNPDEFIRMAEENERIKRRQLVYRNDTVAAMLQRAKLSGGKIQKITLPGLDGQEFDVEITRADLSPSAQSGSLIGKLAGKPESMVTLAFKFGREAFTILSPEDNLYLQADAREPGEVILKSFDPDVYASGKCGNE